MRRGLQLAYTTNKRGELPEITSDTLQKLYNSTFRKKEFVAFEQTAQLALHYRQIAETKIAEDLEELANQATDVYPMAVKGLWELAARLHEKLKDEDGRRRCNLGAVHQLLAMRKQVSGSGAESYWVMQSLQALRHVPREDKLKLSLEADLRRLQKASLDEMGSFPIELEIADDVKATIAAFSDISVAEGLRKIALICSSPSSTRLRNDARELADKTPLSTLIGVSYVDSEGKTIRKTDGTKSTSDSSEESYTTQILRLEQMRRLHTVAAAIEPARTTISANHALAESHVEVIVACSPFIPDTHKPIFALGILKFFQGDHISATHLLVPQLEPCLRHLLKINGISPTKRFEDGTEEDLDLGGMLSRKRKDLETILTKDLLEKIERIFHQRPGPALRHELAHGLLSADQCFNPDTIYAI